MKARLQSKRFAFSVALVVKRGISGTLLVGAFAALALASSSAPSQAFAASESLSLSSTFAASPQPFFAWITKVTKVFAAEREEMALSLRAAPRCESWCTEEYISGWEKAEEVVKVHIPSGASVREIAILIDEALPHLNRKKFIKLAGDNEGFLFPDTYYFFPSANEEFVYNALRENFDGHAEKLKGRVEASGRTLHDIVTMASIIEEEARDARARREIAGVLWKRIEIDMPLQVDVTFQYINGKNSFELTRADLAHGSLYNTYRHKGLPPTPITNPGLDAIEAALTPEFTNNLYFLSDLDGNLHFSKTFPEHLAKKEKYIP